MRKAPDGNRNKSEYRQGWTAPLLRQEIPGRPTWETQRLPGTDGTGGAAAFFVSAIPGALARGTGISVKASKGVVIMRKHMNGCRVAHCECGAQVRNGSAFCEKCSARHRWMRRKAWRKFYAD